MRAAVLLPVKAFAAAKARLAPALGPHDRATLARTMAEHVLRAVAPLPVAVACDDDDVAAWANDLDARVVWTPGLGLNGAAQQGVAELADDGFDLVLVVHADLPRASGIARLATFPGVTIVPDRHEDGSNIVVLPPRAGFVFAYGPGSFGRHVVEARRLGLPLRIARRPELQWDVDTPADLPAET
jgi:2-phospho-L-lactate guanylyltransferase